MFEAFGQRFVFCGVADSEAAGRHIPGDYGACGDYGAGADGDAFQDDGSGSDEAAFPDADGLSLFGLSQGRPPSVVVPGVVHIVVQKQRVCAYQRVASDADAVDADQSGPADAAAVFQSDARLIGKGSQKGMLGEHRIHAGHGVDGNSVANGDGGSWEFFNPGQPGEDETRSGTHSPEFEQQAAYSRKKVDKK